MNDKIYERYLSFYGPKIDLIEAEDSKQAKYFYISCTVVFLLLISANLGLVIIALFMIFTVIPFFYYTWCATSNEKIRLLNGLKRSRYLINLAMERERAKDYDKAIEIWEKLKLIDEAARVRTIKNEIGALKLDQTVVHGDQVTKTEVRDSVLNHSNIGSSGDDKLTKIKELKELHDVGAIDDDEFKQMKKEILGK